MTTRVKLIMVTCVFELNVRLNYISFRNVDFS